MKKLLPSLLRLGSLASHRCSERRAISERFHRASHYPRDCKLERLEQRAFLATTTLEIAVNLYEDSGGSPGALIADDTLIVGQSFFAEVVAGDIRSNPAGVIGLALDIDWPSSMFEEIDSPFDPASTGSPLVTAKFPLMRGGTLNNASGLIDELAGGSLPAFGLGQTIGVGTTERFGLLHFRAEAVTADFVPFHVVIGSNGVSFADATNSYTPALEVQTIRVVPPPGITIDPTLGLTTTEDRGTATFAMVLDSPPAANVTIGLSSSDETEGTVSPASVTFTSADWNVAQVVRMTGIDDSVVDGSVAYTIVTTAASSEDPNYNNLGAADVSVTNLDNDALWVTSLDPTATGFSVSFNHSLNTAPLNLYGGYPATFGDSDVTLVGAGVGPVRGSLALSNSDRVITFIRTGGLRATNGSLPAAEAGVLAPDTYTVTLRSDDTGLQDLAGVFLDGNADGVPGDEFTATFTIDAPPANVTVVSVQDFARGYGQPVNLPANDLSAGIPLTVSDGATVSKLDLTVHYDPALLDIQGFALAPTVAARGVFADFTVASPGLRMLTITAPVGVSMSSAAGRFIVGTFESQVPDNAPYGGKHILDIADLHVYDTATPAAELPAVDDDALHVAAFLGDTNGDGKYNSPDATLVRRIIGQLNTGFSALQMVDPVLTADITQNGFIQSSDTTGIRRAIGQVAVPYIPALPTSLTFPAASGADPRVYIPRDLAGAPGATVTVPVMIDVTEPAGITIGGFDLVVEFDPGKFTVSQAKLGALLQGTDLAGTMTQPAPGKLIFSADSLVGTPLFPAGTVGNLLTLTVGIAADAAPGPATWNLLAGLGTSRTGVFGGDLQELVLNPAPTNGALDLGDGVLLVDDGLSPWHNTADGLDVNADGLVSALDALIVINRLNAEAAGGGPAPAAFYYDVNDDSVCTAQDVLVVIDHLNAQALSAAEGEPTTPWSPAPTAAGTSAETNLQDRVFHDLERDLSSLEDVLGDLADDIARVWR